MATLANRALTVEMEAIEKRLAEIAVELARPTGITDAEFFNEMSDLCAQFGIPIQEEAGSVYLVNVRFVPLMAALEG